MACSTCRNFRRSVAGRLGYCQMDRTRQVLRDDEVRDCWVAPAEVAEPLLGLFGSLEVAPARSLEPVSIPGAPRPPAPTAAAAAQKRWDEIVAAGAHEDGAVPGRGGSVATTLPTTPMTSAAIARGLPAWLDPGPGAAPTAPIVRVTAAVTAPVAISATVDAPAPSAPFAPAAPKAVPAPLAAAQPVAAETIPPLSASRATPAADAPSVAARAIPVRAWAAEAPAAATPMPAATSSAMDSVLRWRHAARDERLASAPAPEEPPGRRTVPLSLLPATLANRLRRGLGTRGLRAVPMELGPATTATPMPAAPASPRTPAARGPMPLVTSRPTGVGHLVDAPLVPPSGTIVTLGDQLRRAEQIRRERALVDVEPLRGDGGGDPRR